MAMGGEEGEAMYVHEDYQNHPYQPVRSITTYRRRLGVDDTKRSLPL